MKKKTRRKPEKMSVAELERRIDALPSVLFLYKWYCRRRLQRALDDART